MTLEVLDYDEERSRFRLRAYNSLNAGGTLTGWDFHRESFRILKKMVSWTGIVVLELLYGVLVRVTRINL